MPHKTTLSDEKLIEAAQRLVAGSIKQAAEMRRSAADGRRRVKYARLQIAEGLKKLAEID
jgi:hypothetical protein